MYIRNRLKDLIFSNVIERYSQRFTQIISEQYVLLITNKGYTFDSCEIENERLVQKITVVGSNDDFRMTYRLSVEDQKLGVVAAAVTDVSEDVAT